MDLLLNVPYFEKDKAKMNGALWNPKIKKWYVKEDTTQDYYENWNHYFAKWLPEHNLLCKNLFIFQMNRKCWKCGKSTKVVCLGTNDAYTLFMGEIFDDKYENLQLLSYVSYIPEELALFLKEKYNYYPSYSNVVKKTYYINHCEFCKSVRVIIIYMRFLKRLFINIYVIRILKRRIIIKLIIVIWFLFWLIFHIMIGYLILLN